MPKNLTTREMKQLLIILTLCLTTVTTKADDFKYLILESNDGTTYSMSAMGLTLTFSDGNLVSSDGTTVPLSSLTKMYFSETSGISTVPSTSSDSRVTVYTISGIQTGTFNDMTSAVSNLSKGLYIIKQTDGSIIKYTVK